MRTEGGYNKSKRVVHDREPPILAPIVNPGTGVRSPTGAWTNVGADSSRNNTEGKLVVSERD